MTTIEELKKRTIYFYAEGQIAPYGKGSSIRQFTNLRAYLDLGFTAEVIQFLNDKEFHSLHDEEQFSEVKWTKVITSEKKISKLDILAYYLGFPRSRVLNYMFPNRRFVLREVKKRQKLNPKAIHHFEYETTASCAVCFRGLWSVWSSHDIFSNRIPMLWEMRDQFIKRSVSDRYRSIRLKRLRFAEDWLADSNNLILCIADHESREFRDQRGYQNAELFPMSCPDEEMLMRTREWFEAGKLILLHLGTVSEFLGYGSLKFILEEVFPLLRPETLLKIELNVVGKINESVYSKAIMELAEPYPQVKFLGFVDDIKDCYAESDLHLVGALRATGLRTRIVESFAYGVPVLSTVESAKGIVGLENGSNIFLAEDAKAFAADLDNIINNPEKLEQVSNEGRRTYLVNYSRDVSASKLANLLSAYFQAI
jgi:glycosyltransferase involved in cell wall biosynthesis